MFVPGTWGDENSQKSKLLRETKSTFLNRELKIINFKGSTALSDVDILINSIHNLYRLNHTT